MWLEFVCWMKHLHLIEIDNLTTSYCKRRHSVCKKYSVHIRNKKQILKAKETQPHEKIKKRVNWVDFECFLNFSSSSSHSPPTTCVWLSCQNILHFMYEIIRESTRDDKRNFSAHKNFIFIHNIICWVCTYICGIEYTTAREKKKKKERERSIIIIKVTHKKARKSLKKYF